MLRLKDIPKDERPGPVVRVMGYVILACLFFGIVLGMGRDEPLWEDALVLLIPAGALMMLQATLLGGRRTVPAIAIRPTRLLAPGQFLLGAAFAAFGLEHLDPDRPWSVLMTPGVVLLGLLMLREALLGDRSMYLEGADGRWQRMAMRAGLWMFGLGWPIFALAALGLWDL